MTMQTAETTTDKKFPVGIDLGTEETRACHLNGGKPSLIKFHWRGQIPSVLYVDYDGSILVGKAAKELFGVLNSSVVHFARTINGVTFISVEVAAEILKKVHSLIIPPETPVNAVITVPNYFTALQRSAIKAGGEAGFNVVKIIPRHVAAVRAAELTGNVLVVDIGEHEFNLSTGYSFYSDHNFGADDFINRVYDYLVELIQEDYAIVLDERDQYGFRDCVKFLIADLSEHDDDEAKDCFLFGEGTLLDVELHRKEFNDVCAPLYEKITARIKKFLGDRKINSVLVIQKDDGIPDLEKYLREIFAAEIEIEFADIEIFARGACLVANDLDLS